MEEVDENDEAEKVAASLLEMTAGPPPPLAIGDSQDEDSPTKPDSPSEDASPRDLNTKVLIRKLDTNSLATGDC